MVPIGAGASMAGAALPQAAKRMVGNKMASSAVRFIVCSSGCKGEAICLQDAVKGKRFPHGARAALPALGQPQRMPRWEFRIPDTFLNNGDIVFDPA